MATWGFDSNKMTRWFILGFKVNIAASLVLIILAIFSVLGLNFYRPTQLGEFKKLGVTTKLKSSQIAFDYYVIENYQRLKEYDQAHQLLESCQQNDLTCYSHRLTLSDWRQFSYNQRFFLDDWWLHNCKFWYRQYWDYPLRQTLALLPSGTEVVFNEHYFNSFERFVEYIQLLQSDYPQLKFVIGVQVHLQWFDPALIRKLFLISQIKQSGLPWMLTEFSIYDRIYKSRLLWIDRFIPTVVRRSISAHSAWLVSRACGQSPQCQGLTIWAPNGVWMIDRLPSTYDGEFLIWNRQTKQPTSLYWAIKRGLSFN